MTKTELLAILESRVMAMTDPVLAGGYPMDLINSTYETESYYGVSAIVENRPDCVAHGAYHFYVYDEGLPTEVAKWPVSEHLAPRVKTPTTLLMEFLDDYVTAGTVKNYIIRAGSVRETTRTALVDVLWSDNTWRLYRVFHNGTDFELELITTA